MYGSSIPNPRVRLLTRIRFFLHAFLFLFSAGLLSVAAVVLAYSIRVYRGSFLHATPELLTAGGIAVMVMTLAWVPRKSGTVGVGGMNLVLGEAIWSAMLCLCFFGGVTSLHESTPGLLTTCGGFFICKGYIAILCLAWFAWLSSAIPLALLVSSAFYQQSRRRRGTSVWFRPVTSWDWFYPDEASAALPTSRRQTVFGGEGVAAELKPMPAGPRRGVMRPRSPTRGEEARFELPPEHLAPGYVPSTLPETYVIGDHDEKLSHAQ